LAPCSSRLNPAYCLLLSFSPPTTPSSSEPPIKRAGFSYYFPFPGVQVNLPSSRVFTRIIAAHLGFLLGPFLGSSRPSRKSFSSIKQKFLSFSPHLLRPLYNS
ncbi:hypothetical protein BDR04DRAFT_1228417, partial [Suillus decipiens]